MCPNVLFTVQSTTCLLVDNCIEDSASDWIRLHCLHPACVEFIEELTIVMVLDMMIG